MPSIRAIVLLVATAALAAGALPAAAQRADGPATVSAPALPRAVGDFRLYDTSIHADPLIGVNYDYFIGRNLRAVVAVHPPRSTDGEPEAASSLLADAVESFRRGRSAGTLLRDEADTLVVGGRRIPGHVVASRTGGRTETWFVYFLGSRYVRVMGEINGPAGASGDPAEAQRLLDAFVREAVPLVVAAWQPERRSSP